MRYRTSFPLQISGLPRTFCWACAHLDDYHVGQAWEVRSSATESDSVIRREGMRSWRLPLDVSPVSKHVPIACSQWVCLSSPDVLHTYVSSSLQKGGSVAKLRDVVRQWPHFETDHSSSLQSGRFPLGRRTLVSTAAKCA